METQDRLQTGLPDAPVLVGGFPRSGTTLVAAMLACAPKHAQAFELNIRNPSFVSGLEGRYTRNIFAALGLPPEEYDAILATTDTSDMNLGSWSGPANPISAEAPSGRESQCFSEEFQSRASLVARLMERLATLRKARTWGFKILEDIALADAHAAVWPEARFVVVHRDPRRAIPSALDNLAPHLTERLGGRATALRFLAERWSLMQHSWQRAAEHTGLRSLELRLEDLISDPGSQMQRLADFLELSLDNALEFHQNPHVIAHAHRHTHLAGLLRPLASAGSARPTPLPQSEEKVILDTAGEAMQRIGYLA